MGPIIMDPPTTAKYNKKIEKALRKFLTPKYAIKNEVYLNLFLTHLTSKNENNKNLIEDKDLNALFVQWVIKASHVWQKSENKTSITILSFGLNLASQLSINEQIFVQLNSQNVYESLVAVAQNIGGKSAIIVVAYITLLCSFLEHKSGLQWVLATNYWTEIVNYGLKAHTLYIKQKAYDFIIKLLQRTIKFNKKFCLNLLQNLLAPLKDDISNVTTNTSTTKEIVNSELYDKLKPTLIYLSELTESFLKNNDKECLSLLVDFGILEILQKVLLISQNEEFSFLVIKNLMNIIFFNLCCKLEGIKLRSRNVQDIKGIFDIIESEIAKGHSKCVLNICCHAVVLWNYTSTRLQVYVKNGEDTIEFQNQALVLQLMPMMLITLQMLGPVECNSLLLSDDYRREYIQKWVKLSAVNTLRLCFKWIEKLELENVIEVTIYSFQVLTKTKKYLNKEEAARLFQPMVYGLKDILTHLQSHPEATIDSKLSQCLDLLIEMMIDVVKSFDITWKDSIETISVLKLACEFLSYNPLINKLVVRGLKLLDMAISRYMSPSMVLLMDNHKDSVVAQTGSLLYAKCHDSSWEIRDSALEVVHTLSMNANVRFPSFKSILTEAELPDLVLKMALRDGEYYVRSTAMKCLQELIQIPEMWEFYSHIDNFWNDLLNIFENETEGIVRKEAAILMYRIIKHQDLPDELLPRIYDVMTHAASGDLHWEVKQSSLKFWFIMVERLLMNQGMLDRTFPSVTFSKEHKKIVTLNEKEIRKRIIKVLNQLCDIGCLAVIKSAIEEDCDIEVSKMATWFALKLLELFKQYNVPCDNIDFAVSAPNDSARDLESTSQISDLSSPQFSDSPATTNIISPFSTLSEYDMITPPNSVGYTQQSPVNISVNFSNQQKQAEEAIPVENFNVAVTNIMDYDMSQTLDGRTTYNASTVDKMLDELLNSNDMTLLQNIYTPTDSNLTNTVMKKKSRLLPSEFVKFIYNSVEKHSAGKVEWLNSLDEFDSLLDDILREYSEDPNVNSMDCY